MRSMIRMSGQVRSGCLFSRILGISSVDFIKEETKLC